MHFEITSFQYFFKLIFFYSKFISFSPENPGKEGKKFLKQAEIVSDAIEPITVKLVHQCRLSALQALLQCMLQQELQKLMPEFHL